MAAERRQQRIAEKRRRDLERQLKQQAKLTEIEKGRCEVELYENQIELLLSVHKEQGPVWDWTGVAAALPPPQPRRHSDQELRARQRACLAWTDQGVAEANISQARAVDEGVFQELLRNHRLETADLEKIRSLARRILAGEAKAYTDALVEFSPLCELSSLGSNLHFTVHGTDTIECILKVNSTQAIPSEVKTLTAAQKLSVKPMPRARFHELYQDYICGCILRVAREVLALLPVATLLITATADVVNPTTGTTTEEAVLSAIITRAALDGLDFERLDPSDTLDSLPHRGNFKASRKAGAFAPIAPLTLADVPGKPAELVETADLLLQSKRLREEVQAELSPLRPARPSVS